MIEGEGLGGFARRLPINAVVGGSFRPRPQNFLRQFRSDSGSEYEIGEEYVTAADALSGPCPTCQALTAYPHADRPA